MVNSLIIAQQQYLRAPIITLSLIIIGFIGVYARLSAAEASSLQPAASVDHHVITVYDLQQRVDFSLIQSGAQITSQNRTLIAPRVLESLILETLHLIEAERLRVLPSDQDVDQAIASFEQERNFAPGQAQQQIRAMGIDDQTFAQAFRAQLAWENVIYSNISPLIENTDTEVEREVKRLKNLVSRNNTSEVRLFMILLNDNGSGSVQLQQDALLLRNNIVNGAQFSAIARQFSGDYSAQYGGDMGWLPPEDTEGALRQWLSSAKVNDLSPPIMLPEGVALFKVQDERSADEVTFDPEVIRTRIGNNKLQSKVRALERNLRQQAVIRKMIVL